MIEADLHIHTYLSDGSLSPHDAILYAKNRGIKTLAIADHETIAHFDEFSDFAKINGVALIPAIEINVSDFKNFHLVGYGVDTPEDRLFVEEYLGNIRNNNIEVCRQVLKLLKSEYGIDFTEEEVCLYNVDGVLDKKAIAKALIDKGYVKDTKSAYDEFIGRDTKAYVPIQKITAEQAIDLIHAVHGVIVWAHPMTIRKTKTSIESNKFSPFEIIDLVKHLKLLGLDGIECFTSHTTPSEESFLVGLANENGLLVTGGSDFHNHILQEEIGSPRLTIEHVSKLKDRIRQIRQETGVMSKETFMSKYDNNVSVL